MSILIFCIGLLAQACFSARILIQWFLSEKKHEVISPTLFWVFSLIGSYLMFYYGWLRNDFSIIVGQFISFYIYIGNLRLKGVWRRIPVLFRILLAVTPLLAAIGTLQDSSHFVENFLKNEDIPVWLIVFGTAGQFIFTFRFIYQWIYSSRKQVSALPPTFWVISLVGSCMIVIYGVLRHDPILILGQSFGFLSYIRNLMIGHKKSENKKNKMMKRILVTGAAGFIGSFLVKALAEQGNEVVGIDNLNDYYDVNLKYGRLKELCGIQRENIEEGRLTVSTLYSNYRFVKGDITDRDLLAALFDAEHFDIVCNLAAQAGVRYSLVNPYAYAESNLMGFLNILEACRHHHIEHLVYASSSSVYGMNEKVPFCETDMTDTPVSLYAATKKSNELMAHAYSNLYHIPATGLRFFTVYGPWGRPDMAPYLFMKSITKGEPIRVFNHGKMRRDFTYIDDIIQAVVRIIGSKPYEAEVPFRVYNIGHSRPVELMDFIHCIERATGKEAVCRYEEMQPGDVTCTYADTTRLEEDFQYAPSTEIQDGIQRMYEWFESYFNKNGAHSGISSTYCL